MAWWLYSTVSITQAPSLITSLCMISVPKVSSQFSIAAGAPTIKSCLPVTGRRDKDKKHLPLVFSGGSGLAGNTSLSELPFFNFIDVLHHTHRNFIKMFFPATEVRVLQGLGE